MKKRTFSVIFSIMLILALVGGCSSQKQGAKQAAATEQTADNEPAADTESAAAESTDETASELPAAESDSLPAHNYIEGYTDLPLYQEIEKIEQCTSADELCSILSDIYDDEVSCQKIEYNETNSDYLFTVGALYDVSNVKYPVESDVYVFLRPYHETPIFIMDDEGSYPVEKYEIKNLDSGSHVHYVSAWKATDLFLCLHEFADCDGDVEQREELVQAVSSMDWYLEYEELVRLSFEK